MPEESGSFRDLDPKLQKEITQFIQTEVRSQITRKVSPRLDEIREEIVYEQKKMCLEDTGPIDTEKIHQMTKDQKRQNSLNQKQQQRHNQKVAYVDNEPIKLKRLIRSFKFAAQGFVYVVKTQPNMKVHLLAAILAVLLGFLFRITASEWLSIILVIGFVLILEVLNTAIETLVDLYTEDFSFLAGVSKDLGATSVLIMAVTSVIVGGIIFIPKIFGLFMH